MLIGLVDETQSLVRVVLSHFSLMASAASQWFHGLFMPPQKVRGGSQSSLSAESVPLMAAPIV